ncbi:MAG TPA: hypothetical protein VFC92_02895 [Bacteroidales bacterium]|nr:hypothetical protein [Flavobacterium sp.]HZK07125.1 hypothetical protein [Bacteroidales bacterium]
MKKLISIKPEHKKYIRLVAGILILLLGGVFMLIPFIPLGYVLVFAGLFLLAQYVPFLRKLVDKLKKKDKKGRIEKVEKKINEAEEIIDEKLVEDENKQQ